MPTGISGAVAGDGLKTSSLGDCAKKCQQRASQFDPTIDKERKLISNLRWNVPVLVQLVPNVRQSSR